MSTVWILGFFCGSSIKQLVLIIEHYIVEKSDSTVTPTLNENA